MTRRAGVITAVLLLLGGCAAGESQRVAGDAPAVPTTSTDTPAERSPLEAEFDHLIGLPVGDAEAQARAAGLDVKIGQDGRPISAERAHNRVVLIVGADGRVVRAHRG